MNDDIVTQLLRDPLLAARKAAQLGQRVIGYVGAEVPVELIIAADALPVRLRGLWDIPTPRADEYLEHSFVPETRAIAEQWLNGDLDFMEAVIFPRSNDSAQRLYYYLCELQRRRHLKGPRPLLYDLATIARDTSAEHTLNSTRALAEALGVITSRLDEGMHRIAQRETLLARLSSLPGSTVQRVMRAAEYGWSREFDAALSEWLTSAQLASEQSTATTSRVVLTGSVPPDERIHLAIEAGNATVVRDLTEPRCGESVSVGDSAVAKIAHRCHRTMSPAQAMLNSSDWLVQQTRDANAHGVIVWLIEEDEALPWEVATQTRALAAANIPLLMLTRSAWRADAATLTTITDFARSLERRT